MPIAPSMVKNSHHQSFISIIGTHSLSLKVS
jgi:hypothetical protein